MKVRRAKRASTGGIRSGFEVDRHAVLSADRLRMGTLRGAVSSVPTGRIRF
jgi:hypothetical protein